jgi:hypothetical protein
MRTSSAVRVCGSIGSSTLTRIEAVVAVVEWYEWPVTRGPWRSSTRREYCPTSPYSPKLPATTKYVPAVSCTVRLADRPASSISNPGTGFPEESRRFKVGSRLAMNEGVET